MTSPVKKVLVTGATGYVGSHVVKQLLEGGYDVRGTVRSLTNEEKLSPLKSLPSFDKLELVEADLLQPESIDRAVAGCSHVLHVASVFSSDRSAPDDSVIRPAVEGTKAVLEACLKHKVKRLVVTSSTAAIVGDLKDRPNNWVAKEDEWAAEDCKDVYFRSKLLAEKSVWKFMEGLEEADKFEVAVVNPAFIQGPTLGRGDPTSFVFAKQMMERQIPFLPNLSFGIIDVRDVALAHIRAMTLPEAVGKRVIVAKSDYWVKDIAVILHKEFASMGYNIPTSTIPSFFLKIYSYIDSFTGLIVPMLDKRIQYDNSRMKSVLKMEDTIPLEKTIIDMGHSLVQNGVVKKTSLYQAKSCL